MKSTDEIIKIYASNIKRIRRQKQITQAAIAEQIGITDKYWSDIETGRKSCSLDTLISIANALEVEPYELLLPEEKRVSDNSRRTKIIMKTLKDSFTEMVDELGRFLEDNQEI